MKHTEWKHYEVLHPTGLIRLEEDVKYTAKLAVLEAEKLTTLLRNERRINYDQVLAAETAVGRYHDAVAALSRKEKELREWGDSWEAKQSKE